MLLPNQHSKSMKLKQLLLAVGMVSLVGCANTGAERDSTDYGEEVDTPDVLLEETSNKQTYQGDKDYGLDPNAKDRAYQVEPDQLEQGLVSKRRTETAGTREPVAQSQPQAQERVEPRSEPISRSVSKPVAKPKVKKTKPKTEAEKLKRDSALEVADPLLGEVEPA